MGSGRLVVLIRVGIGIAIMAAGTFLISWGGGHRVFRAVGSALATTLFLAGLTAIVFGFSTWPSNPSGDPNAVHPGTSLLMVGIGFGIFFVGLLVATGANMRRGGAGRQWTYYSKKTEDFQQAVKEGEERSRIDRELKGR